MKGLAAVCLLLLLAWPAAAGSLEFAVEGGPTAVALVELNADVDRVNAVIRHVNETLALLPNVEGQVPEIERLGGGICLEAAERYRPSEWLGIGGKLSYARTAKEMSGQYVSTDTSEISSVEMALDLVAVGALLDMTFDFLDAGILLGGGLSAGYYFVGFAHTSLFEIPEEYPEALSGLPPDAQAQYSGGGFGLEASLHVSVPVFSGFSIETAVAYRYAQASLADGSGQRPDLDGNGPVDRTDLSGMTVRIGFSWEVEIPGSDEKE